MKGGDTEIGRKISEGCSKKKGYIIQTKEKRRVKTLIYTPFTKWHFIFKLRYQKVTIKACHDISSVTHPGNSCIPE